MSDRRLGRNEKKKKLWRMEEEKRCKRRKSARKKTAFDRVLLESKPRDTFESLEITLFFLERERGRKRKMSPNHTPPKTCALLSELLFSRAM